jgi:hypothetical protein
MQISKSKPKKISILCTFKSLKKGVGSGVGSRSGSAPKCHGSPTPLITLLLQWEIAEVFYTIGGAGPLTDSAAKKGERNITINSNLEFFDLIDCPYLHELTFVDILP